MVEQKNGQAIRCPVCGTHITNSHIGVDQTICPKCHYGLNTLVVGYFVVQFPWDKNEEIDCVKEIDSCIEQMQKLKKLL